MTITSLIDNAVQKSGLAAEHGLSQYIEDDSGARVLFDTGQTGGFIDNAKALGVDLGKADALVLSHGHYDHTGGLDAFCEVNSTAAIYVKESLFVPKYGENNRFIGTVSNDGLYGRRLRVVKEKTEIFPGFFIMPDIRIANDWDTHFHHLFVKPDGEQRPDDFSDELFLAIVRNGKTIVVSGCSHRGITNIVRTAAGTFSLPVQTVIGGFHLKNEGEDAVHRIADDLAELGVENIAACHCTGIEAYAVLRNRFGKKTGGRIYYHATGNAIVV